MWAMAGAQMGKVSPGRGGGASHGQECNIQSRGWRCSLERQEPELQGLGGPWDHGVTLGCERGLGGEGFRKEPGVSLELPRYSIE